VLQLSSTARSNWLTVFAFDLDARSSQNDIEINSLPIGIDLSDSTWSSRVNRARLVVDGTTYTNYTVSNANTDSPELLFDFGRNALVIDADERVTAQLQLQFNSLPSQFEGMTLFATTTANRIDAEGAEDLSDSQLRGAASSEMQTLRTQGVVLANVTTTAELQGTQTGSNERGVFTIRFDVTAFDSDIYVNRSAASGTTMGSAGANYLIENSSGTVPVDGTVTAALSSNASVSDGRFVVREGQTRTFTLSVTYNPDTTDFYRLQLYSINFNDTNANPDTQQRALPAQNYETGVVSIRE
jgi:hypothetical protein